MKPIPLLAFGLLAVTACTPAAAGELDITARFRVSAAEPSITHFVNTTPLSGYCQQRPDLCRPDDVTITIPLDINRTWQIPAPIEAHNYQRVDGTWKEISIHSSENGGSYPLRFRLNLLARQYLRGVLDPGASAGDLMARSSYPGINGSSVGGCSGRTGSGNIDQYNFAWIVPADFRVCSRPFTTGEPFGPYSGSITRVSIGYELVNPNPLRMPNGTYTGVVSYDVGRGKAIDLGEGEYSDSVINFNLTLTVEHQIRVEFPANSDRVLLEPDGGWLDWLNKGRRPTRLYREQPFRLWGSAPMHMYLTCEYAMGNRCGIANNRTGEQVPVDITLTLPDAFRYQGQLVQQLALPVGQPAALTFDAIRPLLSGRSQLHYSVAQEHMAGMLANAGTTYQGDVTIIFDAEI